MAGAGLVVAQDDSAAPANPGRMVAGYGYFGIGGTMAEYLERELAWRRETGQDRPVPPKPAKQEAML